MSWTRTAIHLGEGDPAPSEVRREDGCVVIETADGNDSLEIWIHPELHDAVRAVLTRLEKP